METRAIDVVAKSNPGIKIKLIPGHFATNHSHINFFIDLTKLKTRAADARLVGEELARKYADTSIDTIVCMDDCEIVAAFLANALADNRRSINAEKNIRVLVPEYNTSGQMIFRDNIQGMIWQKNVLLLIASATTGKTLKRAFECIRYYSGTVCGVAALFSATDDVEGVKINSIFSTRDVPGYMTYSHYECPACAAGQKIDALVNAHGYSKI